MTVVAAHLNRDAAFVHIFFKYGPTPPSFRGIIAKLFTNSITTDVLKINWAYPRLVGEACLRVQD